MITFPCPNVNSGFANHLRSIGPGTNRVVHLRGTNYILPIFLFRWYRTGIWDTFLTVMYSIQLMAYLLRHGSLITGHYFVWYYYLSLLLSQWRFRLYTNKVPGYNMAVYPRMSELQTLCRNLTKCQCARIVVRAMTAARHALLNKFSMVWWEDWYQRGTKSVIKTIKTIWSHLRMRSTSCRICIRFWWALFCGILRVSVLYWFMFPQVRYIG